MYIHCLKATGKCKSFKAYLIAGNFQTVHEMMLLVVCYVRILIVKPSDAGRDCYFKCGSIIFIVQPSERMKF